MSNLRTFAERELRIAGLYDSDSDYGGMIPAAVLALIDTFAGQGHSGFSANLVASIINKLLLFQPLTPLTGEDDEWITIHHEGLQQNKRCNTVFRNGKRAWNVEGLVFTNDDNVRFTSKNSVIHISFPYTPTTVYVSEREDCPEAHNSHCHVCNNMPTSLEPKEQP